MGIHPNCEEFVDKIFLEITIVLSISHRFSRFAFRAQITEKPPASKVEQVEDAGVAKEARNLIKTELVEETKVQAFNLVGDVSRNRICSRLCNSFQVDNSSRFCIRVSRFVVHTRPGKIHSMTANVLIPAGVNRTNHEGKDVVENRENKMSSSSEIQRVPLITEFAKERLDLMFLENSVFQGSLDF